jgi:hypothetical protein
MGEKSESQEQRAERARKQRMFWFYTGYIMALEVAGLDASKQKEEIKAYGG